MALLMLFLIPVYSQGSGSLKKWDRSVTILGGASRFYLYNNPESVKYPSAEFGIRYTLEKPISTRLSILTGIDYTEKFKRDSYYFYLSTGAKVTKEPTVLPSLDHAASHRNQRAISFPIQARYTSRKGSGSINVGLLFRVWIPYVDNNAYSGVLNGTREIGLLVGIQKRLISSLSIGVECYHGLTSITPSILFGSSLSGSLLPSVINQNLKLSFTYHLRGRN